MLRIIHLLSSNTLSGAEKVAISIIRSQSENFDFFYASPNGPISDDLDNENIEFIPINNINPISLLILFLKVKPNIVHSHDFRASINLGLTLYPCKKISHIHQNPPWLRKLHINTVVYAISTVFFNKIITVSDKIFTDSIIHRLAKFKIINIPNFVDIKAVELKSRNNSGCQEYDLIFVGRFSHEKDPLRFIGIVKRLVDENPYLRAAMIGDGLLMSDCLDIINKKQLAKNIDILGYLKNPFPVMKNSKILVVTSKWEGFGLAAVEALSLGKPVVAMPVGGLNNIVNHENGGICISDDEFVKTIQFILDNNEYYKALSLYAKISVQKFSHEFNWLDEYKSLGKI